MRKGPAKSDPRGGVRRNVRRKVAELAAQVEETPPTELYNTCPKCKERAKPTDQFCRKDGTRLTLGRACERCASPCEEGDNHCWQCGWKLGDPLPVVETEIAALPPEEVKRRLREKLIEKGYAVPDTLVG